MSWQDEVNNKLDEPRKRREQQEREAREKQEKRVEEQEQQKQEQSRRAAEQALQQHISRFKCAASGCSVRSSGPYIETSTSTSWYGHHNFTSPQTSTRSSVNYNKPTGLNQCEDCGQWFCPTHYHSTYNRCQPCLNRAIQTGKVK